MAEYFVSIKEVIFTKFIDFFADYSEHFLITQEGVNVILTLSEPIPQEALSNISILILEIEASAADTLPGYTTVILEIKDGDPTVVELSFTENLYIGHYSDSSGLEFDQTITLSVGYEDGLIFALNGGEYLVVHKFFDDFCLFYKLD